MLASAVHDRFDIEWLAKFMGIPRRLVNKYAHNLRKNSIWQGRKICSDWTDEKEGGLSFVMDSMVAVGLLNRSL